MRDVPPAILSICVICEICGSIVFGCRSAALECPLRMQAPSRLTHHAKSHIRAARILIAQAALGGATVAVGRVRPQQLIQLIEPSRFEEEIPAQDFDKLSGSKRHGSDPGSQIRMRGLIITAANWRCQHETAMLFFPNDSQALARLTLGAGLGHPTQPPVGPALTSS